MISLIRRLLFGPRTLVRPIDLKPYGVANCKDCHKYLRNRAVLRLMAHLGEHHKMSENDAISVSVEMADRVFGSRLGK
jgi:hypothetical protein